MANVKKCDRCGAIFNNGAFGRFGIEKYKGSLQGKWYDLCQDCLSEFDEWMKSNKNT